MFSLSFSFRFWTLSLYFVLQYIGFLGWEKLTGDVTCLLPQDCQTKSISPLDSLDALGSQFVWFAPQEVRSLGPFAPDISCGRSSEKNPTDLSILIVFWGKVCSCRLWRGPKIEVYYYRIYVDHLVTLVGYSIWTFDPYLCVCLVSALSKSYPHISGWTCHSDMTIV